MKSLIVGVRKFLSVRVILVDVLMAVAHIHKHKPPVHVTDKLDRWADACQLCVTGVSCLVFPVTEGSGYGWLKYLHCSLGSNLFEVHWVKVSFWEELDRFHTASQLHLVEVLNIHW